MVTPDLPVDDDTAGAAVWAAAAIDAIDAAVGPSDPDVVVVGHSIAGLCLPVIADRRRIRRMVFLSALVPVPGEAFADRLAQHPEILPFVVRVADIGEEAAFSWESVRDTFYHDCPEAIARRAFGQLRTQSVTVFVERCPIDEWPPVATTSIVMRHDRVVSPQWSREVALGLPDTDLVELNGGHSPFFADPNSLSAVLEAL